MRLLVSIEIRCAWEKRLRDLLWLQCHGVAELFETMEMVTLYACPILVIKVIGSQVGVGFLRSQKMVDDH